MLITLSISHRLLVIQHINTVYYCLKLAYYQ